MNYIPINLKSLHISRFDKNIYLTIIQKKHLNMENISDLYQLNLLICQEFYIIIHTIETLFKYILHKNLSEFYNTPNWVNKIKWQKTQSGELKDAAKLLPKHFHPEQLLDNLSFGFWVHLLDFEYNVSIFHSGISKIFPNHPHQEKLTRTYLKNILTEALEYRNKIAHSSLIIHEEKRLLKNFRLFMLLISWMDEDYYKMVKSHIKFKTYYRILVTSSYSRHGFRFYLLRQLRRLFFTALWGMLRPIGKLFNIKQLS